MSNGSRRTPITIRPESLSVDAACVIESEDEVHASDHADRNAVGEINEELGHSHALASHCRDRMVQWITHEPFERRVLQPHKPALLINEEPTARETHSVIARTQLAASGRSLRPHRVPCQLEIRPSTLHLGQCQSIASSWARAAATVLFLHLKHLGSVMPALSKSVA